MSKFWDKVKKVASKGFDIVDPIGDAVSPKWKAITALVEQDDDAKEAKEDFVSAVLSGTSKLLDAHDFPNLNKRQNEIVDEMALLAVEFGIIHQQLKKGT